MHTQNSMSRRANSSSRSPSTSSGSHSRSLSPVNSNPNSGGSSSSSSDTLKVKSKIKSSSSTSRTQIASKKPPSTGKVAKKSVPSKRPVAKKSTMKHTISPTTTVTDDGEVSAQSEQSSDHYDVDDDLLGALANELEESLEDNSNDSGGSKKEVESEQEDSDYQAIQVVESKNRNIPGVSSTVTSTFSSPALGTGPMSLRGFADSSRRDEDDLSSSEEE